VTWKRGARSCLSIAALEALLLVFAGGVAGASRSAEPATPSQKAKMVCAPEAQRDIAGVLASKVTVTKPTWTAHLYSCTYRLSEGSFVVSVKQLKDRPSTIRYFDALGETSSRLPENLPMGDAAFRAANGSIVVRKDNNVLHVDVSELPVGSSALRLSPSDVASSVATTILGCWTG
jgi:hypothetical protein